MPIRSARKLLALHDELCVRRAWPRDASDLADVEAALNGFSESADTKRFRRALADTGIAGTDLHARLYFPTARWVARNWPERLFIDWSTFEDEEALGELLPLLLPDAESLALDNLDRSAREWLEALTPDHESDGAFLIGRFSAVHDTVIAEHLFDRLDPPMVLALGPETPSRTTAWHRQSPVVFGPRPVGRPPMPVTVLQEPDAVRRCGPSEGRELLDLARASMLLRHRDLDAFAHGNEDDVVVVDWPEGMQIAVFGMLPDRRLLLESCFGHLVLQNGVPVGYGTLSALFQSVDIAYNIFPAFRGHGASWVMGRLMATAHTLFDATSFHAGPYQLGQDNEEGIESGAWWYYEKLGFRPDDGDASALRRDEKRRLREQPGRRTSRTVLRRLASHSMFFDLDGKRGEALGRMDLGAVGDAISRTLRPYGSKREKGIRDCVRTVQALLRIREVSSWSPNEREALRRWAPLLLAIPSVKRWSRANRAALAKVIRAKGAPHEVDFVRRFDAHGLLRRAVFRLSEPVAR